jgi:hypothetical protein
MDPLASVGFPLPHPQCGCKILLYRRNNIAHGQFIKIDIDTLRDMSERVIKMMRKLNNLVDNEVSLRGYRA